MSAARDTLNVPLWRSVPDRLDPAVREVAAIAEEDTQQT
jgi:hypothetical protein